MLGELRYEIVLFNFSFYSFVLDLKFRRLTLFRLKTGKLLYYKINLISVSWAFLFWKRHIYYVNIVKLFLLSYSLWPCSKLLWHFQEDLVNLAIQARISWCCHDKIRRIWCLPIKTKDNTLFSFSCIWWVGKTSFTQFQILHCSRLLVIRSMIKDVRRQVYNFLYFVALQFAQRHRLGNNVL